jgi:hypothetical protein
MVKGGTITSSPAFTPRDSSAVCKVAVPLTNPIAKLVPM